MAAAAAPVHTALRSVGARSTGMGRARSSTSLTTRLSRATSVSMSAAASRHSARDALPSRSTRSEPLMIISGLRISWATTVESRPSADSRSRWAASRWKRAMESVRVLNVVARRRASSSSQCPGESSILRVRSPVVAISRMVAVIMARGRVTVRATA